jgi:protein HokB
MLASYSPHGKEKKAMKHNTLVMCLLIVCMTILAFTLLTRQSLYELRIRDGNKEVAASMACKPQ